MSTVLQAMERSDFRNSSLRELREQGNIPAVVYGTKVDNKSVYISSADLIKTIREIGRNGIISLDINGSKHEVILSDYQHDPLRNEIIHADFRAVDMSSEIHAEVRLVLVGDAAGVKDGGVMQQPVHAVTITAKPNQIPPAIEVDVTNLQIGENLTIGDITSDRNYQINHDPEEVIVSILPPKQEEEGDQQEGGTPENEQGGPAKPSEE
ncbi:MULTISPECIES: 50S ribosomal protein L25/general stress protein Ctc [Bacillus]|uniref:50S ribosomal protein L25/general stress protein Ctc n=1 Tax=Bacillus TaxID=1386 RepID=UPI000C75E876|nr:MULTISPECIES: 50S ribosomal protein L25/general stress protein Ctc [Bacillus]PLR83227.1 50S ribosomal protein L25/general stress protein Ctc [Bacillus sp. V33-4]RSK56866.1 50S ribosomal protein L25/general stress protein Ctc [Bacillus canaveralius]